MTGAAQELTWPRARLGDLVAELGRASGLVNRDETPNNPPPNLDLDDSEAVQDWLDRAATGLGLEIESTSARYGEIERVVRDACPAVLTVGSEAERRFLAILGGRRGSVRVLTPSLVVSRVSVDAVRELVASALEAEAAPEVEKLAGWIAEEGRGRRRVVRALLAERLRNEEIEDAWLFRLSSRRPFRRQLDWMGIPGQLVGLLGVHALATFVWIMSWWMIGRGALGGRLDAGLLVAWALLLLTLVPLRLTVTWMQGRIAIGAGVLLKHRLLAGALRLEPDEIRRQGTGQLLGRVIESDSVQSLALDGGFTALTAAVQLVFAAWVLGVGAGGILHLGLLAGWVIVVCLLGRSYVARRGGWTEQRLEITQDLVERMVGHRTRLAQEDPSRWHDDEDRQLRPYLEKSLELDRSLITLVALAGRGWLLIGVLGLIPAFVRADSSAGSVAVGVGGILLAYEALAGLSGGLAQLSGAAIGWRQVAPLFRAAARGGEPVSPAVVGMHAGSRRSAGDAEPEGSTVLTAQDLSFGYEGRAKNLFEGADLEVRWGDRLLLEGPSGGGKSTFAAVLSGLRKAKGGLLLLGGLDRATVGDEGWRRRVVSVPQFHDNHVLSATFAFNLLLGRRWPPTADDLAEAEAVCRELGLGDLLERMPAGLEQMVGETGWQLSHGERSRLFIARSLLQGADLVILDESFAALDPENLVQAMRSVLDRSPTLLVIAHP